ncbi:SigE family RNA polymerase sigma factor [Actinoplanes couchii]|uniref:RNA polymerase sigma24 factor n=1 Tax=Actinoplanes couchii TaxID=403638 RepID=A0ABQ3XEK4_9ACTN|nr:SigE family RNA polymerase sigma factor [Actinoplanes couchii]MDR6319789.1 RNA polymerase sigma-70 factor (sigma-E family) [Actinoplanes couchii]GID56924.1 RNA polymerase sigma24 factor [Actinoplanes couchii]
MRPDDDGFPEFVRQQWGPLLRSAYLLTGDRSHAEDLVQAALEKTHRKWRKVAAMDAPTAYVYRVMVNTATSWRRRRSWGEIPQLPADTARADDPYEQIEHRQQLYAALRKLPPKMRAVLVLRYFQDMSEADTADIMGCSVGSVKSQASRGLQRLRDHLDTTDLRFTADNLLGSRP